MGIKAVFSDLDGTLLTSDHKVSDLTKYVINELTNRNIKFFIATGRNYPEAKIVMEELGMKFPLITSNGAQIHDENGKVLYLNLIKKQVFDQICSINYKKYSKNIFFNVISGDEWYVVEDVDQYLKEVEWDKINSPILSTINELKEKNITKCFYFGDHESLLLLEKEILERSNGLLNVVFVLPTCLELFDINSNKLTAIEYISELYGIQISEIIAFGDGFNDYEMLKYVKQGFIMGNAFYRLIEALPNNEIIDTNDEDGVAKKLLEIFNIKTSDK